VTIGKTVAIDSAADVAAVLRELDAPGKLPLRTVIVPTRRYLHGIRKALLLGGGAEILLGLDGLTTAELAGRVLSGAGVDFSTGEEDLRPARIQRRIDAGQVPSGFDPEAITGARGWDRAFARAIDELEHANLRPGDLAGLDDPRAAGVAGLWSALDEEVGSSWTRARAVWEAVQRLGDSNWKPEGPIVAVVTADTPSAELQFLAALPGVVLTVHRGRVLDEARRAALANVMGLEAVAAAEDAAKKAGSGALAALQTNLFRGEGEGELDDSFSVERHDGVEREVEAAARWVGEQIQSGTPLEEIAVLGAVRDPFCELLYDRITALGLEDAVPIHVAGGLPLRAVAGGPRLMRVLRALQTDLSSDAMWDLLPLLRLAEVPPDAEGREARTYLRRSEAFEIAFGLGTAGGHPILRARAREWPQRTRARIEQLKAEVDRDPPAGRGELDHKAKLRALANLERLLPALDALDSVIEAVHEERPIGSVWAAIRELHEACVAGGSSQAVNLLGAVLERGAASEELAGDSALEGIVELADRLRAPTCRFGDPAVFIGSVGGALGLSFSAVRVVGLAEGTIPPRPRPDVILTDGVRGELGLSDARTRAANARRRLFSGINAARGQLVLSCPRVVADAGVRAASPVFIEALAAVTGHTDVEDRLRDAFAATRTTTRAAVVEAPQTPVDRATRAAVLRRFPTEWNADGGIGLSEIRGRMDQAVEFRANDGHVVDVPRWEVPPGLGTQSPISASRLEKLLQCPHQFFSMYAMSWRERSTAPSKVELDALTYGTAIHTCAEQFFVQYGSKFEQRIGKLADYLGHGDAIVEELFEGLRDRVAFENADAWSAQVARARTHFTAFLQHEWARDAGKWVAAELAFGYPPAGAVQIETSTGPMWVRGDIDRLRIGKDEAGKPITEIWDIKSGKSKGIVNERTSPDHLTDLQIGVYAIVAQAKAAEWKLPKRAAAGYVYTNHAKGPERAFDGDKTEELVADARRWLGVARDLLEAGLFPRTPNEDDCNFCHLRLACGPAAPLRADRLLRKVKAGPLAAFAKLKGIDVEGSP
jgi:hypothetical protein